MQFSIAGFFGFLTFLAFLSCQTPPKTDIDLKADAFKDQEKFNVQWEYEETWYPTGELKSVVAYSENQIVFIKNYYRSGRLKEEIPYQSNKIHGVRKTFDKTGVLKSQKTYVQGLLQEANELALRQAQGEPLRQAQGEPLRRAQGEPLRRAQGEPLRRAQGEPLRQAQGELSSSVGVKIKSRNGLVREFYADGKVKWEFNYKDGKKNGLARRYSRSGNLIKKLRYFEDGSYQVIFDATQ